MPIAVLILALVAYAYAMVAYPEYRTWGLVFGGLFATALGVYFWLSEPEAARTAVRITPEELTLDELTLDRTPRGATFRGRVRNDSEEFRLREMTIALRLHDCPTEATPIDTCPVIGEASAIARPEAPPGQIRGFSASYVFANLPPITGILRYEWRITELRATR